MADRSQMEYDDTTGEAVPRADNRRNAAPKSGTVMMSIRVPLEFKEKLAEMSKEQGVSQTELVISGVEDAASLSRALAAVDDYLRKNPPPFAPDDWAPSSGECMSFVLRAVQEAIGD